MIWFKKNAVLYVSIIKFQFMNDYGKQWLKEYIKWSHLYVWVLQHVASIIMKAEKISMHVNKEHNKLFLVTSIEYAYEATIWVYRV